MEVTELGISTEVRPEQPVNAYCPMEVTELGISIEVRPEQPENAYCPMEVTELGMTVFLQPRTKMFVAVSMIALQLFLESNTVFSSSTVIEVRPVQPPNACCPMEVTELPISTEVRPEQP